jgi:aconitate hydratase
LAMKEFLKEIEVNSKTYHYFDINQIDQKVKNLPISLKILLENLVRNLDDSKTSHNILDTVINSVSNNSVVYGEINFHPSRVLMQDLTGVPAIVDLASMRERAKVDGINPENINPIIPVDLVVDHSIMVDHFATNLALEQNTKIEYERNIERYKFLKWAQKAFKNLRVIPSGMGICHQINLEYLAKVVCVDDNNFIFPDTVIGTDSHTPMVNGLSVLGWGVGGIEAEAAMLGQPNSMTIPQVLGVRLFNNLSKHCFATDLVLHITNLLRNFGVVGKFVEFFGDALENLSVPDRATIANMAPEYGATCGFFPIDNQTLDYLRLTNRDVKHINLLEAYAKKQGLWSDHSNSENYPNFYKVLEVDLSQIEPLVAGPKRPQDKILLKELRKISLELDNLESQKSDLKNNSIKNHDVVLAAITSCTNTSNPDLMIGSGIIAKKAFELGLKVKPWVKTSLAPGSRVVKEYLEKADLLKYLENLGFNLVGYGCTTCIGNSGNLLPEVEKSIKENNLMVASVLSGNRNFEGRIHPLIKENYLMSPILVVAYAIAGTTLIDFENDSLGVSKDGKQIFLKDLLPSKHEIHSYKKIIDKEIFAKNYATITDGDKFWQGIKSDSIGTLFNWDDKSSYIKNPPYFSQQFKNKNEDIKQARILGIFADSVTTDHISPAGNIKIDSSAGKYLTEIGIKDFNSYGSRRGNHDIMTMGTFANVRLQNKILDGIQGGFTKCFLQDGKIMPIYEASCVYKKNNIPLVIFAGKEYGAGSSRDWAAKGVRLLGVKAIIAESFERIHRSNLVGMGILPLVMQGRKILDLNLEGDEVVNILGAQKISSTNPKFVCEIFKNDKMINSFELLCRIDTLSEVEYFNHGGILNYVYNSKFKL